MPHPIAPELQAALAPDETLVWAGRPGWLAAFDASVGPLLGGALAALVAAMPVVSVAKALVPLEELRLLALLALPFALWALFMFSAPWRALFRLSRTWYAITDRRVLLVDPSQVQAYGPADLAWVEAASGDVFFTVDDRTRAFTPAPHGATFRRIGFARVSEPERVLGHLHALMGPAAAVDAERCRLKRRHWPGEVFTDRRLGQRLLLGVGLPGLGLLGAGFWLVATEARSEEIRFILAFFLAIAVALVAVFSCLGRRPGGAALGLKERRLLRLQRRLVHLGAGQRAEFRPGEGWGALRMPLKGGHRLEAVWRSLDGGGDQADRVTGVIHLAPATVRTDRPLAYEDLAIQLLPGRITFEGPLPPEGLPDLLAWLTAHLGVEVVELPRPI